MNSVSFNSKSVTEDRSTSKETGNTFYSRRSSQKSANTEISPKKNEKNFSKSNSPVKKRKSSTIYKKKNKSVTIASNFIQIVEVESFKKYNLVNTHSDPADQDTTKCSCYLF